MRLGPFVFPSYVSLLLVVIGLLGYFFVCVVIYPEESENCLNKVFGKVTDRTRAGVHYDPAIAPEDDPNGWPTMEA